MKIRYSTVAKAGISTQPTRLIQYIEGRVRGLRIGSDIRSLETSITATSPAAGERTATLPPRKRDSFNRFRRVRVVEPSSCLPSVISGLSFRKRRRDSTFDNRRLCCFHVAQMINGLPDLLIKFHIFFKNDVHHSRFSQKFTQRETLFSGGSSGNWDVSMLSHSPSAWLNSGTLSRMPTSENPDRTSSALAIAAGPACRPGWRW